MDYKLVKYCKHCKKRFTVSRGEAYTYYCDDCKKLLEKK